MVFPWLRYIIFLGYFVFMLDILFANQLPGPELRMNKTIKMKYVYNATYRYDNNIFPHDNFEVISHNGIEYRRYEKGQYNILARVVNQSESFDGVKYDDTKPTFFHIPKTGGTSLETALVGHRIRVGQYAFEKSAWITRYAHVGRTCRPCYRNYSIRHDEILQQCSLFHVPPVSFVPKSITIIREPFER